MKNRAFARLVLLLALTLIATGCNLTTQIEEVSEVGVKMETEEIAAVEVATEEAATETKVEAEIKAEVSIEPRVIAISGDEYSFSPSSITVNEGEKVKVVFTNIGQNRHNWVIGGLNLSTRAIGSNETDTLEFTADASGSYEVFCSIAGHKEAGMVGSLMVK